MSVLWLSVHMDAHSVVDDWDAAPFDGGFAGLDELASRGFSGAVEARGTWLFLREGEPLAVVSDLDTAPRSGNIDTFDGASGQQHEAPNQTVATLAAMLALDGDVRGQYFTDDTPIEAVDETLSGGGFTGYVELSENVLSGHYYFVYVDGEVDHVGFVGSSQLLLGEDAESRATDEVGIYAVTAVRLPRPELPAPPEPDPEPKDDPEPAPGSESASDHAPVSGSDLTDEPTAGDTERAEPDDDSKSDPTESSPAATSSEPPADADTDVEPADSASVAVTDAHADAVTDAGADSAADVNSDPADTPSESDTEDPVPTESASAHADTEDSSADPADAGSTDSGSPRSSNARADSAPDTTVATSETPGRGSEDSTGHSNRSDSRGAGGIEAVTTRTVPSLDPENSGRSDDSSRPTDTPSSQPSPRSQPTDTRSDSRAETSPSASDRDAERREEYESKLETYESRIEELEDELDDADARIEELETEIEAIRSERDELQARLDAVDSAPGTRSMPSTEALAGTSLFVRETTRGEATLEDAHDGNADRETVASNLRIEYHTTFDDGAVSVDGEPFESWLRASDTHAFAEWLVMELLFEIRSTGSVEGLRPLYDALPRIDRIGFEETIAVGDGTDGREVSFDIVARNKKGNPLVVIEFDRQRDPTRAEAIEPFVTDASDVCEDHESLACAVAITSSYFESDAMGAVEEATSTSLLSRSKHRSYVKLSRANGYHLCLVEARDGSFNLTVPEL
jgi:hypothetical protein